MARIDFYFKVRVDVNEGDKPEKVGAEIVRQIERVYGVRYAEMTNFVGQNEE